MAQKREASPSNESAPKKQRKTKKVFVPPEGWEETPGWTTKPIHTSRCDMGQCGRHVTDDNPAKQCRCGLNVCWICEQARGGLHRGLWHDCVHYRATQDATLPAPQDTTEPSQPPQLPASQTPGPSIPEHNHTANDMLDQPSHVPQTTTRATRSGSAPPAFGKNVFLDKIVSQGKVNSPHPPQANMPHNFTAAQVFTLREAQAETATPQSSIAQPVNEGPGQPVPGQGSTGVGAWTAANVTEANPTQTPPAAAGPPTVASSNIGQSPPLPPAAGYKEPIVRMRELTLLFRRPVAVSLQPVPHRDVHAAESSQAATTQLMLSPSLEDVGEFDDIAASLATSPHELDGVGVLILRALGRAEVSNLADLEIGNGTDRCVQGLSREIPQMFHVAAARLESFAERWSPIEIMDSLLERVRAIRSSR